MLTRARRDSLCSTTATEPCTSYIERTVWDGDQLLYELRTQGGDDVLAGTLNADVSTASVQLGKVGYVHAGGIDAPLVLMDGRVPNYNWRGLAESSVWLDGSAADCTVSGGAPCTQIYWPGNQGVYMKPPLGQTSLTDVGTWVGSLLANGVGSTGMAYRRNRFYDGATGQFNQQDPIGLAGGANSYGFAGGDPVNYSDPFGLAPCPPDCDASDAADLAAGATPGLSTLHDAVTLLSGRNVITGEDVGMGGRLIAGLGLITPAGGGEIRAAGKAISFARHAVDQVITRGVKPGAILDAFRNPLKAGPVKLDELGRPSQRIVGRQATVAQNPETGKIVSVNPTSTKRREKLEREKP